jgi:hypothetical protein
MSTTQLKLAFSLNAFEQLSAKISYVRSVMQFFISFLACFGVLGTKKPSQSNNASCRYFEVICQ